MITRKALRIARREYAATVKTKGFIFGLIVMPLMMSGGAIAMILLKDSGDTRDKRVAVLDRSGVVLKALVEAAEARNARDVHNGETGEKVKPAYRIEEVEPSRDNLEGQRLELSNRIRRKELHAFLEIGPDVLHPGKDREAFRISYHAENAALDDLRRWMDRKINHHLQRARLAESGVGESAMKEVFTWLGVEGRGLVSLDEKTGEVQKAQRSHEGEAVGIPVIMMMLMFMLVMFGAMPLLHSVMEEKSLRIAEVLLGSVSPFEFMMGKVLGGIGVSLTGSAVYVLGGIIALHQLELGEFIPYHILPWFFTYLILNIILVGSMMAGLGAACNDAKEAQALTFPALLPMIVPMFIMMPVVKEPLSGFATGLSLFPLFTPLLMLLRQSTPGGVPDWQPWVGMLGVVACTVFSVWAGSRIFRVAIMVQGQPPRLTSILRWAIRG